MVKNFVDLCKSADISVEPNDAIIKRILKDAMIINVPPAGKSGQSQRKELAAALAWARSRLSEQEEWELLPVPLQRTLQGLYHIREDFKRSTRWVKAVSSLIAAHLTPTASPEKPFPQASFGGQGRVCKSTRAPAEQEQAQPPRAQPRSAVDSAVSKFQHPTGVPTRAEWTASPPYKPPVDYQWCENLELLDVIPDKRRSVLYKGASWDRQKLAQYQKTMKKLIETNSELVEDGTDPLWTHRLAFSYSEVTPVEPAKDGVCLKFMVQWEARALYVGDYAAEEDFERRMSRVHRVWTRAQAVLTSEVSGITNSELNPVLDQVHRMLARRADEAEKELGNKGKAGYEIIAGCRRQQLEVKELFRIYAAQLEESSIEITERRSAGRQANAWYFHLLNPLMTAILGKSSYDPDKDPLVIAIEKIGQGAGTKRSLDNTFAEAGGKKQNLSSFAQEPISIPSQGSLAPPLYWQLPQPLQQPPLQQSFFGSCGPVATSSQALPARSVTSGAGVQGGDDGDGAGNRQKRRGSIFVGQPASADIIGSALAVWGSGKCKNACRTCFPMGRHASWECPLRYCAKLGEPCPGFDAQGQKLATAWSGEQLSARTKAQWKVFIAAHSLEKAGEAPRAPHFD